MYFNNLNIPPILHSHKLPFKISLFLKCLKESCIDCTKNLRVNQIGEKNTIECVQNTFIEDDKYAFDYNDAKIISHSLDYLQKQIEEKLSVITEKNSVLKTSFRYIVNTSTNEIYDFYIFEGFDETEDMGTSIQIGYVSKDSKYVLYPDKKLAYILKGERFESLIETFPNKSKSEIFIEYKKNTINESDEKTKVLFDGSSDDEDVLSLAESLGLY